MAVIAAGVLLSASMLAVLPAASAPASASSGLLTAWFSQLPDPALVTCSTPGDFSYPGAAVEVYNPCGYRVWIHYVSGSTIQSYCVNPGGGLAYDLPIKWAKGDTTDMQLSSSTSQCDAGETFLPSLLAAGGLPAPGLQNCLMNLKPDFLDGSWIFEIQNADCNFRIWLHQYHDESGNGSGNSLCIDPGIHNFLGTYSKNEYTQLQVSDNQTPCDAGGPPYAL